MADQSSMNTRKEHHVGKAVTMAMQLRPLRWPSEEHGHNCLSQPLLNWSWPGFIWLLTSVILAVSLSLYPSKAENHGETMLELEILLLFSSRCLVRFVAQSDLNQPKPSSVRFRQFPLLFKAFVSQFCVVTIPSWHCPPKLRLTQQVKTWNFWRNGERTGSSGTLQSL